MLRRLVLASLTAAALVGCDRNPRARELRLWSDSYAFRVTSVPTPPRALEPIRYRIVVTDKKTGQPIEGGEGRIFASSKDGANTNDGFRKEPELGTYSGRIFFATAGDWAAAIQFRRDQNPQMRLERVDWTQTVYAASEPGT
ncbi:MAG TPA: hypothetical protein VNO75_06415 [Gemmatimonadaceae bacterium]|nr:hypothetical protein [Gemmatimonadaceae bacterium]